MPDSGLRPRPVTLRQLLAAGALGESRVVGGDTGLDRIVEDVLVTDRCDSATPISPGLLVLLAAFLEPLVSADADGVLLRTLQVYLDCQSSATSAAAALGVHRNTVMKRIDRIASTLNVNLHDPDQRLALQLVVRMHRLDQPS